MVYCGSNLNNFISLLVFILDPEQVPDVLQALLEAVSKPDGARFLAGEVGGDAEDDDVIVQVVADAVAVGNNCTVAHVGVRQRDWDLNKKDKVVVSTALA